MRWMVGGRPRAWRSTTIGFFAIMLAFGPPSLADDQLVPGVTHGPAALASRAAPVRQAVIIAPGGSRGAPLASDTVAYSDRLRLLGFDVTTLTADSRPDLGAAARAFVQSVSRDGEVVVLAFGNLLPANGTLYLMSSDATAAALQTDMVAAEGFSLTDLMRRIKDRAPRTAVLVGAFCGPNAETGACAAAMSGFPEQVSAIVAERGHGPADPGRPLGAAAPLSRDLLNATAREGQTFFDLLPALQNELAGSDLDVIGTPALTKSFAFLPSGFFEGLPLECNSVESRPGAETLPKLAPLDPLVARCEEAARRYWFSPFFGIKLEAVREQVLAQKALVGCSNEAASRYVDSYPDGFYRAAVADHQQHACAPTAPPEPLPLRHSPLEGRARAALMDYFNRHDYRQGDSFGGLVKLYPPKFLNHSTVETRADHLRNLGAWYGNYDSMHFEVVPDSLDFTGCTLESSCVMRGAATVRALKAGESQYAWQEGRFVLRLDLTTSTVLSECGVADPPEPAQGSCD